MRNRRPRALHGATYLERIEDAAERMGARDAADCPSGHAWIMPSGNALCVPGQAGHIGLAWDVERVAGVVPANESRDDNDAFVRFLCRAGAIRIAGGANLDFGRWPTAAQMHTIADFWRRADRPLLYVEAVDCAGVKDHGARLATPAALAAWIRALRQERRPGPGGLAETALGSFWR